MSIIELPETVVLPIDEVKPYWRNPRRIPEDAVNAVAESIQRYGYQQPIVVDQAHVVIVGHTRLRAVQQLGWSTVPVYVANLSEEKAKEYRLVDNRTSEMTSWDHNALVLELREWETELLESFFPEVDLEIAAINDSMRVTEEEVESAAKKIATLSKEDQFNQHTTEVVCPACFTTFEVRTKSLPGLSLEALRALADGDSEVDPETVDQE